MLEPVLRPSLMKELVIFPSHDDLQAGVEFTDGGVPCTCFTCSSGWKDWQVTAGPHKLSLESSVDDQLYHVSLMLY